MASARSLRLAQRLLSCAARCWARLAARERHEAAACANQCLASTLGSWISCLMFNMNLVIWLHPSPHEQCKLCRLSARNQTLAGFFLWLRSGWCDFVGLAIGAPGWCSSFGQSLTSCCTIWAATSRMLWPYGGVHVSLGGFWRFYIWKGVDLSWFVNFVIRQSGFELWCLTLHEAWQVLRVSGSGLGLAEFTPPSVVEKRRKSYEAKGEAVTLNHKPDAFEAFKKSRKAQPGWGQAVEGMSHDQCNHMVNMSCDSSTTIVVAQVVGSGWSSSYESVAFQRASPDSKIFCPGRYHANSPPMAFPEALPPEALQLHGFRPVKKSGAAALSHSETQILKVFFDMIQRLHF